MSRVGREASEAVRASERRLAEVLEAIGEAVFAIDSDQRILFANRTALEFWNREADEVLGRRLLDAFPEIGTGEPYQAYLRVLANGRPEHIEARAPAIGNRWIALDAYPAPDGGLVVAYRDIDDRRRAETQLRQSEERLRLMVETLPDIAFVIRPDGMAEHYNQQMRDYVGGPVGPTPADRSSLHPPEDREAVDRARAHAFATGTEFAVEARLRRHDGVYRWHRIRNRPIRVDGQIVFWLGTAVDIDDMREANALLERRVAERTAELEAANRRLAAQIDEREKAEAQLWQAQRIEAVGQLTSGVAHDFNNLLTAIIGNLELLEARIDEDDARLAKPLVAAVAAAERGARLTAQLLAFSRQQRMNPEADRSEPGRLRPGAAAAQHDRRHGRYRYRAGAGFVAGAGRRQPDRAGSAQPGDQRARRDAGRRHDHAGHGQCDIRPSGAPGASAAGRVCHGIGRRHRMRHSAGDPRQGFRPVLHDEGGRQGVGARALAGARGGATTWRRGVHRNATRHRHDDTGVSAARPRREAGSLARRATRAAGRGRAGAAMSAAAAFCWSTMIPMSARLQPRCSPRPGMTWLRPAAAAPRSICSKTRSSESN